MADIYIVKIGKKSIRKKIVLYICINKDDKMKTTVLKKEMFDAINIIEDTGFLKAINLLLHEKSKEYEYELSENEKVELDNLRDQHKAGKSKSFTMAEVRKMAKDKLG